MNRQFKRNSNITLAVMLPVLLAGLACNDSTYENSRTIGRAMVSDEEIERVFNLLPQMGEPHDPVAFQKIADQYPEVFAEQERRNETEAAIRNNDLVLLRKNISENPEYLNKLFAGNPLIQQAAQCGNLEACKILISAGADIGKLSSTNTSALALVKLSPPIVKCLLEAGADPNNRNIFHVLTMYQKVPEQTRLEIVQLFVKHGLDINRAYLMFNDPDALQTVLDRIGDGYPEIRQYLIENGAKHARELVKPGAYDSANVYLSWEQLEALR